MNISEPFIRRPVMTTLVMITIFVLGITAYQRLPVSNLPDVNYPIITVSVPFPGANPQVMANTVATPLEQQFMTIPGIKLITSSNLLGSTTIVLEFEIDRDIDLAAVDVEAAIIAAQPLLPPNLPQAPTFKKVNPSATPILYIALTSPVMTAGQLYDYGNTFIGQRISIIEGVAQVNVYGSPYAVRAQVDPGLASSLGITMQDIANSIENENVYLPLGQFDGNHTSPVTYDNGGLYNAKAYEPVIVAYRNGAPVRLEDLGVVHDSVLNDRTSRRYIEKDIDQPAVILAVLGQSGTNAVKVAGAVKGLLSTLEKQLPGSLETKIVFDRSDSIRASIFDVQLTMLIAFLLVVLVIFVYLGKVRDTVIPSIIMPMAIIATFPVIYLLKYNLDNLSLLALTLAIGFIIDDAIVVLENIVRWIDEGKGPLEASLLGSKQIGFTIVSMTLSLVAVFIPLIFMAGIIGKIFREFANTLTIVTLLSGLIALTITPMLCSRFLPPKSDAHEGQMARLSSRFNEWMLIHYKKALAWVLGHGKTILLIGALSVIISAYLFKILPTDFIPDEDIGFIQAYTEAEQGTSSDQMLAYQNQIVEALRHDPAVASISSVVSNPQFRQGVVFLNLVPRSKRKSIVELIPEFRKKLNNIPGVNIFLKNVPLIDLNIGSLVRGSYQYLMQSLDTEALYKGAAALYDRMRDDPTFQGISTDLEIKTPQWNMDIQRDVASTLGIQAQNFEEALFLGYSTNRISLIQSPIYQYSVILELLRDMQRSTSSLYSIYLRSNTTNAMVPLSAVANWTEGVGPASINHFDQFPAVTITFNIDPNIPLSIALARLRKLASESFGPEVSGDVKGAAQTFEESIRSLSYLLIITVLVIYLILGILYESFIHPLTILSTLPPAILGALLTLYLTGRPLSLYAFLGLILLIGIVKKNGIMIVDYALDNVRNKGESAENAVFNACTVRFRPIMMTTFAAIMGAIPIAIGIGSDSHRPLGLVIIGGMAVSQLITLFLTPVIYLYFERMRERYVKKK